MHDTTLFWLYLAALALCPAGVWIIWLGGQ
jgi:hypothetical protein